MSWTSETNIKGPAGPPGGLSEAPTDGQTYGRKNAAWNVVVSGGGTASSITVTPVGNIASTDVQAALQELDTEKVAKAGDTMTGNLTVNKANPSLVLQKIASGQANQLAGYNGANPRWSLALGDSVTEGGSNAGSNFALYRYTDAGGLIDTPLTINRANGGVTLTGALVLAADPSVGLGAATKQYVDNTVVTRAVRYDTTQGLTINQQAQGRSNIGALKKNYIVNGAMMISQENGATVVGPNAYPADQWLSQSSLTTGVYNIRQVASLTPAGSPNRLRVTVTTAQPSVGAQSMNIIQRVEGLRTADFAWGTPAAKPVTLQFGIKSPVAGTFVAGLWNNAPDAVVSGFVTIAAGEIGTDVVKSVTLTGPTSGPVWNVDTLIGMQLWFYLAQSTQTANVFATNGNIFELFDVGLYEGNVAPPFMVSDYASELALCLRYYNKLFPANGSFVMNAFTYNATLALGVITYPRMRAAPTVTISNVADYGVAPAGGLIPLTAFSATPALDRARIDCSVASGLVSTQGCVLQATTANATMSFNARL
jgi:hypothetical protein